MNPDQTGQTDGRAVTLATGLRAIVAPNPSPMTYLGTNTYLLGCRDIVVIDPGPDDASHLAAILAAVSAARISHIIVTHAHLDHSPLARKLSAKTHAPVYGFGPAFAGRSQIMTALADQGLAGGGEGIDPDFMPDVVVGDGDLITGADWTLTALHTPGHIGNHICLKWGDAIFTGDHVMGWASSLVSPPDGDLTDFMQSCDMLSKIYAQVYYPAHGAPVHDPAERLAWLIAHRKTREAQILEVVGQNPCTAAQITAAIYTDIAPMLLGAATRTVFAHLVDLHQRQQIKAHPVLGQDAIFRLVN
jgi:glyoxylase-like metal-dependent hydrolase (beta-lactamase superfamily II)